MDSKITVDIALLSGAGDESIKGQVTQLSQIQTAKSGKEWFKFILEDQTSDIQVLCFNDVKRFYDQLQKDQWILLSNIQVQYKKQSKYDNTKSMFQIVLTSNTNIEQIQPTVSESKIPVQKLQDAVKDIEAQRSNQPEDQQDQQQKQYSFMGNFVCRIDDNNVEFRESGHDISYIHGVMADYTQSIRFVIFKSQLEQHFDIKNPDQSCVEQFKGQFIGIKNAKIQATGSYPPSLKLIDRSRVVIGKDNIEKQFEIQQDKTFDFDINELDLEGSPVNRRNDKQQLQYSKLADLQINTPAKCFVRIQPNVQTEFTYKGCSKCKKKTTCSCEDRQDIDFFMVRCTISDETQQEQTNLFNNCAETLFDQTAEQMLELSQTEQQSYFTKYYNKVVHITKQERDGRAQYNIQQIERDPNYCELLDFELDQKQ